MSQTPPSPPDPSSPSQPPEEPTPASLSAESDSTSLNSMDGVPEVEPPIEVVKAPPRPKGPQRYPRLMRAVALALKHYGQDADGVSLEVLNLGEHDIHMKWNITLTLPSGEAFPITGSVSLPDVFSPNMLAESPTIFEAVFGGMIMRPLLSKFQTLLNRHAPANQSAAPADRGDGSKQQNIAADLLPRRRQLSSPRRA